MFNHISTILDSTVFTKHLPDDNYTFQTLYFGKTRDLVEKKAAEVVKALDSMRSPIADKAYFDGQFWNVVVRYYSVD